MLESVFSHPHRIAGLKRVRRYPGIEMKHQSNDYIHTVQMELLVRSLLKNNSQLLATLGSSFNVGYAILLSPGHDDPEIITGDQPAHIKKNWSKQERDEFRKKENLALYTLADEFCITPEEHSFYLNLGIDALEKRTREMQFVSWVDKYLCAFYGEVVHELLSGNEAFIDPYNRYVNLIFPTFFESHPLLDFFKDTPYDPRIKKNYPAESAEDLLSSSRMHTVENFYRNTGIFWYDLWKKVQSEDFSLIRNLTNKSAA